MIDNNQNNNDNIDETQNNNMGVKNIPIFNDMLQNQKIMCPKCGMENDVANMRCKNCDAILFDKKDFSDGENAVFLMNPKNFGNFLTVMIPIILVFLIPGILLLKKGITATHAHDKAVFLGCGFGFCLIAGYTLYLALMYIRAHYINKNKNEQNKDS